VRARILRRGKRGGKEFEIEEGECIFKPNRGAARREVCWLENQRIIACIANALLSPSITALSVTDVSASNAVRPWRKARRWRAKKTRARSSTGSSKVS
jgi:hypothetical protein